MDEFLHLEDQWPGWIDVLMEGWSIEVFLYFFLLMWWMEKVWKGIEWELDWKREIPENLEFCNLRVPGRPDPVSVDRAH